MDAQTGNIIVDGLITYLGLIILLTFHEFGAMFRDVARPGPWAQRLKHLWGPPEWERPLGSCARQSATSENAITQSEALCK